MEETIQDLINSYRTAEAFWEAADGVMDDSVKQYFFVLILSQRNNVAQLVDRIDDIREAAESGNPFMQYAYARYLDTFEPTPDSDRIKERYYNLAIDAGIADARTFLAMAYRDGDFGEADIARYHSEMDKAMDEGSDVALWQSLYDRIYGRYGEDYDPKFALQVVTEFIDDVEKDGGLVFGAYYRVKADAELELGFKDEAIASYEAAEARGDCISYYWHAITAACDENWNVTDDELFLDLMGKAREAGASDGYLDYAMLIDQELYETLNADDRKECTELMRDRLTAAYSYGDSSAAMFLGSYYANGLLGFPQDYGQAWSWYSGGAILRNRNCYVAMADLILKDHYSTGNAHEEEYAYECRYKALLLGDDESLWEVVDAYNHGHLTHHAAAIEQVYLPRYWDEQDDIADFQED